MEFHPASNLFPLLEGENFEKFKEDIQKNGCLEPIIILDGLILDGRNRWRACEELGKKPPLKEMCTDANPVEFVLSMNLHRRHLTASQRSQIATGALLPKEEKKAKERSGTRTDLRAIMPTGEEGRAREKVAEIAKVTPRYVQDSKSIQEHRPDLAEKVKSGEITIPQAKREMLPTSTNPPPKQKRIQTNKGEESHSLWNLKRWWKKASKKDKSQFLVWIEQKKEE